MWYTSGVFVRENHNNDKKDAGRCIREKLNDGVNIKIRNWHTILSYE